MNIVADGNEYTIELTERNTQWAKGVQVTLSSINSDLSGTISYSAHPDFDNYEKYKDLPYEELCCAVMDRIESDIVSLKFKEAAKSGLGLLLPINHEFKT